MKFIIKPGEPQRIHFQEPHALCGGHICAGRSKGTSGRPGDRRASNQLAGFTGKAQRTVGAVHLLWGRGCPGPGESLWARNTQQTQCSPPPQSSPANSKEESHKTKEQHTLETESLKNKVAAHKGKLEREEKLISEIKSKMEETQEQMSITNLRTQKEMKSEIKKIREKVMNIENRQRRSNI